MRRIASPLQCKSFIPTSILDPATEVSAWKVYSTYFLHFGRSVLLSNILPSSSTSCLPFPQLSPHFSVSFSFPLQFQTPRPMYQLGKFIGLICFTSAGQFFSQIYFLHHQLRVFPSRNFLPTFISTLSLDQTTEVTAWKVIRLIDSRHFGWSVHPSKLLPSSSTLCLPLQHFFPTSILDPATGSSAWQVYPTYMLRFVR